MLIFSVHYHVMSSANGHWYDHGDTESYTKAFTNQVVYNGRIATTNKFRRR